MLCLGCAPVASLPSAMRCWCRMAPERSLTTTQVHWAHWREISPAGVELLLKVSRSLLPRGLIRAATATHLLRLESRLGCPIVQGRARYPVLLPPVDWKQAAQPSLSHAGPTAAARPREYRNYGQQLVRW